MPENTSVAQIIFDHFPELTDLQKSQFEQLDALYREWNAKINVISRKDIDNLYSHHVLHSLGIAKVVNFRPGTRLLDVGTGGGFPGIPLAILFPECEFVLVDSIGKKIKVANAVIEALGLTNVMALHRNVMEEKRKFDFVVSRAVMDTGELVKLVRKNVARESKNSLPNGLICLKGGDLTNELAPFKRAAETWNLADYFKDEFFETKQVTYVML
jgi:16S rRNA (guanine527-N7)-methyltransferase